VKGTTSESKGHQFVQAAFRFVGLPVRVQRNAG